MRTLPHLDAPIRSAMREVAREVVMPRYRNLAEGEISEKTKGELVTIADQESEHRLAEHLSAILPEAGIVGEEACAADPGRLASAGSGLQWLVDPIDGTGNFAAGQPPFGIMIALADAGTVLAGWMLDPLSGRFCHAILGGGAFVDGKPVRARETGADVPVAALAVHYMTPEERTDIARRSAGRFTTVDIPRCAAEQYPRLVLGENDISVFWRTLPWDHAAGVLFLNEAGGRCARPDGTPYRVGDARRGLLGASSPRMWELAAGILYR